MSDVEAHYARLLGPILSWMAGGTESALATGTAEIEALGLPARDGDLVVDLGAGFGLHAIPLARRGANVVAIDSSAHLIAELSTLASGLPVRALVDDLLAFPRHLDASPAAILCMGDTLTHLRSLDDVRQLAASAAASLATGGRLLLSLRDYTRARTGDERFIPVRADASRILTCFVEYAPAHVIAHDLLHERVDDTWRTTVSHYRKLRIPPRALVRLLDDAGFEARCEDGAAGMVRVMATRR